MSDLPDQSDSPAEDASGTVASLERGPEGAPVGRRPYRLRRRVTRFCLGVLREALPDEQRVAFNELDTFWRPDHDGNYCHRCGYTIPAEAVTESGCPSCLRENIPWTNVVRLGAYQPPLSNWIIAMKYRNRWSWAEWFGRRLAASIDSRRQSMAELDILGLPSEERRTQPVVCAVPMHWRRRWKRGFNQSQLVAASIGRHLQWPEIDLIKRKRRGKPQVGLKANERRTNMKESMKAQPIDLTGREIWLVDDVKTTGSTLKAATEVLKTMNAASVNLAVIAATDPKPRTAGKS